MPTLIKSLLCNLQSERCHRQVDFISGNIAKLSTIFHLKLSIHKRAINPFAYNLQFALSTTRPQQRIFLLSDRGIIKSKKIPEALINKGFGSVLTGEDKWT